MSPEGRSGRQWPSCEWAGPLKASRLPEAHMLPGPTQFPGPHLLGQRASPWASAPSG